MKGTGDQREAEGLALPEEARAALARRGISFLDQLESMRDENAERIVIDPLDPQAELALRQRGDDFLSELDVLRAQVAQPVRNKRRHWQWAAVAAVLIGIAGAVLLAAQTFLPGPAPEETAAISESIVPGAIEPSLTSPPIPEPSSAVLVLTGAVVLISRRYRRA